MEYLIKNKNKEAKFHKDFQRIFGENLRNYFDYMTGFDICGFDEKIVKAPDGKSCREVCLEKYGEEGVRVIEGLLAKE